MVWIVIGFVALAVGYRLYYCTYSQKEDNIIEEEMDSVVTSNTETNMEEGIKTKELALGVLKDIGANITEVEKDRIHFEYQGIRFFMDADDDCCFVIIIWPWCHSFSKFDIDEFTRVRRVVNEVNMIDINSVVYSISDSDEVALHIKKHLLLMPQIPKLEDYLRQILRSFFRSSRTLDMEIEKSRLHESFVL